MLDGWAGNKTEFERLDCSQGIVVRPPISAQQSFTSSAVKALHHVRRYQLPWAVVPACRYEHHV